MARPRQTHPTPAELEVLKIVWEHGPCTVREVMQLLEPARPRAYTSVMSLMNVMAEKGLLKQKPKGRAYEYTATMSQGKAQSRMLKDLVARVFDGSANQLVTHLLQQAKPDADELEEIRRTIAEYQKRKGKS